jgi:hypothetical protein
VEHVLPILDEDFIILVTELHGAEWDVKNPRLNVIQNPGLKMIPGNGAASKCNNSDGIPRRTPGDLLSCVGKEIIFNFLCVLMISLNSGS